MLAISFICIHFFALIVPRYAECSPLKPTGPRLAIRKSLSQRETYHASNPNNHALSLLASPASSSLSPRVIITVPLGAHWQIAVESYEALHPGDAVIGLAADILLHRHRSPRPDFSESVHRYAMDEFRGRRPTPQLL